VSVEGTELVRVGLWNEGSDLSKPTRKDLVPGFTLPTLTTHGTGERWIELWGRGNTANDISWNITVPEDIAGWLAVNMTEGTFGEGQGWTQRVNLTIDWANVPEAFNDTVLVSVNGSDGSFEHIHVPVLHSGDPSEGFAGYVEGDGYVSIDASQWQDTSAENDWAVFPYLGRVQESHGAVAPRVNSSSIADGPSLSYSYFQFSNLSDVNATMYFTAALDTDPQVPLAYGLVQDGQVVVNETRLIPDVETAGDLPEGWDDLVIEQVWSRQVALSGGAGAHTLQYWANKPGMVLEKIVIDLGGLRESLLGPPFSRIVG
jgi:hypothetical protein